MHVENGLGGLVYIRDLTLSFQGVANSTTACLNCYYTCHTCSGPNDYEVLELLLNRSLIYST